MSNHMSSSSSSSSVVCVSQTSATLATPSPQISIITKSLTSRFSQSTSLLPILNMLNNKALSMGIACALNKERLIITSLLSYDLQFDTVENHASYARTIITKSLNAAGRPLVLTTKPIPDRTRIKGFIPTSITIILSGILCYQKTPSLTKMLEDFNSLDIFDFLKQKFNENPINAMVHLSRIICLYQIINTMDNVYHIYFNDPNSSELFWLFESKVSHLWEQINRDFKPLVEPLSLYFNVFESDKCLTYIGKMKSIQ